MSSSHLGTEHRTALLRLARESIERATRRQEPLVIDLECYPRELTAPGAAFVTLTIHGALRGCIGALEATQPLILDVCEHAVAAAQDDYRFPPVRERELDQLEIEISCLTAPCPLEYDRPEQLLQRLRPGIDGVVLRHGSLRATFLPQVWEKLPQPEEFLSQLCQKMGASANTWKTTPLNVFTYQVEEFHE